MLCLTKHYLFGIIKKSHIKIFQGGETMENKSKKSIAELETELKILEENRRGILYEYMSAQFHLIPFIFGAILVGCCGFYFGKLTVLMLGLALYLLLHAFNVVYHGYKTAENNDEYEELTREIHDIECKISVLESR